MKCKICGCTDEKACPGGCYWVAPGVCSNCADIPETKTTHIVVVAPDVPIEEYRLMLQPAYPKRPTLRMWR